jgi:hypothetical protein
MTGLLGGVWGPEKDLTKGHTPGVGFKCQGLEHRVEFPLEFLHIDSFPRHTNHFTIWKQRHRRVKCLRPHRQVGVGATICDPF